MRRSLILMTVIIAAVASAAALSSCGSRTKRDVTTLKKALLGHWVTTERGTKAHYYFGNDGTVVLASSGKSMELGYDVVYADERANKVVIEISMDVTESPMPFSVGVERELVLSKNRKSLIETSVINGVKFTNTWKYADSKMRP